jgi:membrane protein YdbS with pleckstrin-like domain
MLTPAEEKFLEYWEANRIREKSFFRQLSLGMPLGLLMGLAILINFMSGWYTRANMVAYSQSTPYVLILAIVIIAVFCSVFYKRYRWEMNEQHFMELKIKKEAGKSLENMQQKDGNDSQLDEH